MNHTNKDAINAMFILGISFIISGFILLKVSFWGFITILCGGIMFGMGLGLYLKK